MESSLLAGEGKQQLLTYVNAVDVGNFWIGLRDTAPRCAAAVGRLRNLGKRVALLDGDLHIRFQGGRLCGHDNFCTSSEVCGINDAGIGRH